MKARQEGQEFKAILSCVNSAPAWGREGCVVPQVHSEHRKVRGQLPFSPSALHPDDQIQVVRLGSKLLFPLSPISSPVCLINFFERIIYIYVCVVMCTLYGCLGGQRRVSHPLRTE